MKKTFAVENQWFCLNEAMNNKMIDDGYKWMVYANFVYEGISAYDGMPNVVAKTINFFNNEEEAKAFAKAQPLAPRYGWDARVEEMEYKKIKSWREKR